MKKETISLQEFANQVKELADSVDENLYSVNVYIYTSYGNMSYLFSCWINQYEEQDANTPELALAKLKNAINPKQIKDVII